MLHLASGVSLGVDVGNFLQLESAFEGDGIVDASAQKQEIVSPLKSFGQFIAFFIPSEQNLELARDSGQFLHCGAGLLARHAATHLRQVKSK